MKMFRQIVLSSVFLLAAGTAQGQELLQPFPQPPASDQPLLFAGEPKLVFEKTTHDFGKIPDTDKVSAEIKFRNNGGGVLRISNVQAGCGCTVTELAKREYQPGESGSINVVFDPHGKIGAQSKSVTITSNDPGAPSMQLTLMCNIQALVMIDPRIVSMPTITKRTAQSQVIRVSGRTPDFAVTGIAINPVAKIDDAGKTSMVLPDWLEVKIGETKAAIVDGDQVRQTELTVTVKANAPVDRVNQSFVIKTNDSRAKDQNVQIVGEVQGDLSVMPARLSLGVATVDAPVAGEVRITNRKNQPFKILSAELKPLTQTPANLKTEIVAAGTDSYVIRITGNAPSAATRYAGEITVKSDVPGEETIKVQVYLTVRPKQG
jgi:hypothetical protein